MRFICSYGGESILVAIEKDDTVEEIAAQSHMTASELCKIIFDIVRNDSNKNVKETQE